jgi:glycosyltransferase involved in cell wall biosynthesis
MPPENKSTLVSVIIPTYNSAGFIQEAVQSVLEQSYAEREVIVVDDGSSDKTREILGRYQGRVQYIYRQNGGPAKARNAGIEAAKGDLVCFLDSDDLWASNKLELQLAFMNQHREVALLAGGCRKFIDDGSPYSPFTARPTKKNQSRIYPAPEAFTRLLRSNFITTSTVAIRKECFEKVGLFDENLPTVEDRDLWLRVAAHFGVAQFPWMVCKKRLHFANASSDKERMWRMRIRILEKNRSLFPDLAPSGLWNKRLARSYLKLGYLLLAKERRMAARQAAVSSLKHALLPQAAMLIMATYVGRLAMRILLPNPKPSTNKIPSQS